MIILSIDPGTSKSAYVLFDSSAYKILEMGIVPNESLRDCLQRYFDSAEHLAIEQIKSYGMPMGDTTIETCVWIGRFIEAWGRPYTLIPRKTVVSKLCGSARAKDANVRQSLQDRFISRFNLRANPRTVIGKKMQRGPLYGVTHDIWSALAIAICFIEEWEELE